MKQQQNIVFDDNDAWIFTAIATHDVSGKSGVSLRQLISTADMINHLIPAKEDIEDSINKFLKIEAVKVTDNRIVVLKKFKDEFNKMCSNNRYYHELCKDVSNYLKNSNFNITETEPYRISEADFNNAFQEYVHNN